MKTVAPSAKRSLEEKPVLVRFSAEFLEIIDRVYKAEHFENRTAFIRSIVRDYIAEYRRLHRVPRKPYQKRRR